MTFREFLGYRRGDRRATGAHRAMFRVYGESWARNSAGVVDLLTSPAPVYVLDAGLLVQVVRGTVAEALAGSSSTVVEEFGEAFGDEALAEEPAEESFPVAPVAEVDEAFVAPPVNGAPARLDMSDDEKRRRFVRSFLDEQRAARGGLPTNLRSAEHV